MDKNDWSVDVVEEAKDVIVVVVVFGAVLNTNAWETIIVANRKKRESRRGLNEVILVV